MPDAAPVKLSGSGDSIQDVSAWPQIPGLMIVEGNASSRYFGIVPYDQGGNGLSSLVNATDPYNAITPFNFDGQYATRLEIKANDAWTIQIVPLSQARQLTVPGAIQGNGDDVIVLTGATPDTANVTGNSDSRYFGIVAYEAGTNSLGSIVNTTDPYQGTVIVERSARISGG